ncbi:MAG: SCO family protein [Burkholderiaceae bacterium]|nr:SCO family protein [Burkholderiaceae bacterium]
MQVIRSKDLLITFALSFGLLLGGIVILFRATDGGAAFTTEQLRRAEVAQHARLTPDFALVDSLGRQIRLHQFLAKDEKIWIADFVYTRCQTLCSALGTVFQRLQQNIIEQGLQDQVGLLSISFDPRNDTPAALYQYQQRMRLDPAVWQIVSLQFESDRRALLDSFGIIVIPAPLGEFEHNAALHLLTSEGNLVQIVDLAQADIVIDLALSLAHQRKAR